MLWKRTWPKKVSYIISCENYPHPYSEFLRNLAAINISISSEFVIFAHVIDIRWIAVTLHAHFKVQNQHQTCFLSVRPFLVNVTFDLLIYKLIYILTGSLVMNHYLVTFRPFASCKRRTNIYFSLILKTNRWYHFFFQGYCLSIG